MDSTVKKILILMLSILLIACSSSEKKDKKLGKSIKEITTEYLEIVNKGNEIDEYYTTLGKKAQAFLNSDSIKKLDTNQLMTLSIITAGAFCLEDKNEIAAKYAKKAYTYRKDSSISFLPEWRKTEWFENKNYAVASRLAQMKDFIISCENKGFEFFKKGNIEFLDRAEFLTARDLYEKALKQGIQNKNLRRLCYLRLASCLFKTERKKMAKRLYLEAWLLDSDTDLMFGDQETRDFFEKLKNYYYNKYNE